MSATADPIANGGTAHQKSFKRKYRKLRHQFKDVMKQSDELFRQEQLSTSSLRRLQEENTRLLDLLIDLNETDHIPKEQRFNIGSPSRATPPRFLSPTMLATITGGDLSLLDLNDDVESMDLDAHNDNSTAPEQPQRPSVAPTRATSGDDSSSDDSDTESDVSASRAPTAGGDSDAEDDKEAYLEEIREWKYQRGKPGTPPRSVRDKMRADAEQERKDAEEQAKLAAIEQQQAAAEEQAQIAASQQSLQEPTTTNGTATHPPVETAEDAEPPRKPLITETYRRGRTPDYLKDPTPFLMTLAEEEEWYNEIHNRYDGKVPPSQYPTSPLVKADGDPRNPMSVYCWLRKNQPQVFLQGDTEGGEGGGKKAGGRGRGGGRKRVPTGHDVESGDEATAAPVKGGTKRKKTMNGEDMAAAGAWDASRGQQGKGRGSLTVRGGKRKQDGEPPVKRQRSVLED